MFLKAPVIFHSVDYSGNLPGNLQEVVTSRIYDGDAEDKYRRLKNDFLFNFATRLSHFTLILGVKTIKHEIESRTGESIWNENKKNSSRTSRSPDNVEFGHFTLLATFRETRRQRQRERHQTKGLMSWGPFLERPGNLTGPKSYFEISLKKSGACSDL